MRRIVYRPPHGGRVFGLVGGGGHVAASVQGHGMRDVSFGRGGKVIKDSPDSFCDEPHAVAIQADGRMVAAGTAMGFVLAPYLPA